MSRTERAPPRINPEELAARRDELFLLDVRNREDYEEWPIEGSHNVPIYDELLDEDFSGLEAALDEIPRDREVAIMCVAGVTSARAADFLRDRGYQARSVTDGMRGWGRVHVAQEIPGVEGVTQVIRPGTGCVSYVVVDRGEALVVDPSQYVDEYRGIAAERDLEIVGAVDTHAHADHISGGRGLADAFDVPYYLPERDGGELTDYTPFGEPDSIPVGDRELAVIETPGHTPGSVSLRLDGVLFSGDTLFVESVGRPDLEDADEAAIRDAAGELFESLGRLADLPDDTVVLPGHYSDESEQPLATTVYHLREHNELFGLSERETFIDRILESLSDTPANYQQIKRINWGKEPLTEDAEDLEFGPNNCAAN